VERSVRVEAATVPGSSFPAASLAFSSCLFCCSPSTSVRPQTRSLLSAWSARCCLGSSGCTFRDGIVGWIQVPRRLAGCSQVWGYLAEEPKAGIFLFSGVNLLSASSWAVPVPCGASASLLEVSPSRVSFFGVGLGSSVTAFPQAVTGESSLGLNGSLHRALLPKSPNPIFIPRAGAGGSRAGGVVGAGWGAPAWGSPARCSRRASRCLRPAALAQRLPRGCSEPLPAARERPAAAPRLAVLSWRYPGPKASAAPL